MVVRSYIIPSIEGQNVIFSRRFSREEVKKAFKFYLDFFFVSLSDYSKLKQIKDWSDLNDFLNYFVFKTRAYLYVDPDPKGILPRNVPRALHTAYMTGLYLDPKEFAAKLYEESKPNSDFSILLNIPGDYRPGANSFSYIVYSQTISAIAVSKFLQSPPNEKERQLALLRLYCIFVPFLNLLTSKEEVVGMMREYGDEVKNNFWLNDLLNLLEGNDSSKNGFNTLYNDSIKLSLDWPNLALSIYRSCNDELRKILDKRVSEITGRLDESAIIESFFQHQFWSSFSDDEVQEISEHYVKSVVRLDNKTQDSGVEVNSANSTVKLVRLDIKSIQQEIKVNDIRTMAFGSFIVDFCIFVFLPVHLSKRGLPAECTLYYGGGNTTLVVPEKVNGEDYKSIIKGAIDEVQKTLNLTIRYGFSDLLFNFPSVNREVELSTLKEKVELQPFSYDLHTTLNIFDRCSICGRRNATSQLPEWAGSDLVCETCRRRYDAGNEIHFSKRLQLMHVRQGDKVIRNVMQYLAGNDPEDLNRANSSNIALVKMDANIIGQYMGSTVNLLDAFERSITIDRSIKKAYSDFLTILEKVQPEDSIRTRLGTIYVGGDDLLLFVPSRISVYLAVFMLDRYFHLMGGTSTLSSAIVAAKPTHPVMALYDSAQFLLDEVSKAGSRNIAYRRRLEVPTSVGYRGTISFFAADGGLVDSKSLHSYLQLTSKNGSSLQHGSPYILTDEDERRNILTLLSTVSIAMGGDNYAADNVESCVERDLKLRFEDNNAVRNLKSNVVQPVKSIMSIRIGNDDSNLVKVLFTIRQSKRTEGLKKQVYQSLLKFAVVSQEGAERLVYPLEDVSQLVKLVIG
jgi:hypothetical protein